MSVGAFSKLVSCRFGFIAENGQRYPHAFELASNVTAVCTSTGPPVDGQTDGSVSFDICEVGEDERALECKPQTAATYNTAGEYQVVIFV